MGTPMTDAIKDNLSPEAVAAIVAWLQPANTNDRGVDREVRWFADQLTEALGGAERLNDLMEELVL